MQDAKQTKSLEEYFNDPNWGKKLYKTITVLLEGVGVHEYKNRQKKWFYVKIMAWTFSPAVLFGAVIMPIGLADVLPEEIIYGILLITILWLSGWFYLLTYQYDKLKDWWLDDELYTPINGYWSIRRPDFSRRIRLNGKQVDVLDAKSCQFGYVRTFCFKKSSKDYLVIGVLENDDPIEFDWMITQDLYMVRH